MGTSDAAVIEAVSSRKALPAAKRQHRSPELKVKIVQETLAPGASVARVARAHGVNANQVFAWRKLYQSGLLGPAVREAETDESRLLPVAVVDESAAADAEPANERASAIPFSTGAIHIEFPGRALVSVEGSADPALVRAVLESLKR